MASVVFHIIATKQWEDAQAQGHYRPERFAGVGFIHLSERDQILRPAHLLYAGQDDLKLLVIEADRLRSELIYEPGSHGEDELFPHLYGELNLDAVVEVVDFPCNDAGGFELPASL